MFRAGITPVSTSGATSISVSFGDTFTAAPTTVIGTVGNTASANYLILYPFVVQKSTTGCTFEFNGAVDSSNYSVSWVATDDSNIAGATGATGTAGAPGATGAAGATGSSAVPSKAINRLQAVTSISNYDYTFVTFQTTSEGIPVTYRMSLSALKTFLNS